LPFALSPLPLAHHCTFLAFHRATNIALPSFRSLWFLICLAGSGVICFGLTPWNFQAFDLMLIAMILEAK
jgi:hypothetical protein